MSSSPTSTQQTEAQEPQFQPQAAATTTTQTSNQTTTMKIDTTDLTADLTAPVTSPVTSPHSAADAERAMHRTDSWKPELDRRQSFSQQEYRHQVQMSMSGVSDDKPAGSYGGFTEEPHQQQ